MLKYFCTKEASYIGGDTDLSQLQVATQNVHLCKKEHNIFILMANSLSKFLWSLLPMFKMLRIYQFLNRFFSVIGLKK